MAVLSGGGDVEAVDAVGCRPLDVAPLGAAGHEVRSLLLRCAMLCSAAWAGDVEEVRQQLSMKNPPPAAAKGMHGCSSLHLAASGGHYDIVRLLIDVGAPVDSDAAPKASYDGYWTGVAPGRAAEADFETLPTTKIRLRTPLMMAIAANHITIAELLISEGADPSVPGMAELATTPEAARAVYMWGSIPLWLAAQVGDVDALTNAYANDPGGIAMDDRLTCTGTSRLPEHRDLTKSDGRLEDRPVYTALHLACARGHTGVVKLLLEWIVKVEGDGAKSDLKSPRHALNKMAGPFLWTPLHVCVWAAKPDLVRLLLTAGANQDIVDICKR